MVNDLVKELQKNTFALAELCREYVLKQKEYRPDLEDDPI